MPILGLGVFQIPDGQTERAVSDALAAGYRSIDTAAAYRNEEAVGRAIRSSGIAREDLFITTKVWVQDAGEANTTRAFEKSLERLGLEYLDLYLIHQPSATTTASGVRCRTSTGRAASGRLASRTSLQIGSST